MPMDGSGRNKNRIEEKSKNVRRRKKKKGTRAGREEHLCNEQQLIVPTTGRLVFCWSMGSIYEIKQY